MYNIEFKESKDHATLKVFKEKSDFKAEYEVLTRLNKEERGYRRFKGLRKLVTKCIRTMQHERISASEAVYEMKEFIYMW